jgi:phospholipid/cholesterol/gamma-HCH transport system substrate-binding protein
LAVFVVVSIAAVAYAVVRFTGITHVVAPPYTVSAEFTRSGGIYPRAAVDLLGTPVGTVSDLRLTPNGNVMVVMVINHGVSIPADVTATVTDGSALGEQYVEITPRGSGGPTLHDGGVIRVSRTSTPIPVQDLLSNLDSLATSVPVRDLGTDLRELAAAFNGAGPDLQHLLDDSNALTRTALANQQDLINLINSGATVLDTQVSASGQITAFSQQLAGLTDELRQLDPTFARTFVQGIQAGQQVTNLLADNASALPQLLDHLLTVTDVTGPRLQELRKTLVVFPWDLQAGLTTIRYCDDNDPTTGQPIPSTCHYDPTTGRPVWTEHFALQLPQLPGMPAATACVNGYQDTTKYLPNGTPTNGSESSENPNTPANTRAYCAASPTDPSTPNIRGAQNAQRPIGDTTAVPGGSPSTTSTPPQDYALEDPNSGTVVTGDGQTYHLSGDTGQPPPTGAAGLAWLLTQPLSGGG